MEVATHLGSVDSVEKGEETRIVVVGKRVGKETKAREDPLMNHGVTVLAEAIGLQKVGGSGVGEAGHS